MRCFVFQWRHYLLETVPLSGNVVSEVSILRFHAKYVNLGSSFGTHLCICPCELHFSIAYATEHLQAS